MTPRRFCNCAEPSPETADGGVRICSACGEEIASFEQRLAVRTAVGIARIERQLGELAGRLDRLEREVHADQPSAGASAKLLEPAELARRLGRSRDWIYANADRLGAIRVGDGPRPRLLFDLALARERLAAIADPNGSGEPAPPKPKRRRRRSSGDVELLPIRESQP